MFKKSTTPKTKAGLGGKQYKTIRGSLESVVVGTSSADVLESILPKKALVVEGKVEGTISASSAPKTFGYLSVNEVPLFLSKTTQGCATNTDWQAPSGWFPTTFFLLQHPALDVSLPNGDCKPVLPLANVPIVLLAPRVPEYLMRGADVMLPGVIAILPSVISTSSAASAIPVGTFVVLAISGQPHAFAVGETLVPLAYGGQNGDGKCIQVLQIYGDTFHDTFYRQVLQQQQKGNPKGAKTLAPSGFDPEGTYVHQTPEYLERRNGVKEQMQLLEKTEQEEGGAAEGKDDPETEEEVENDPSYVDENDVLGRLLQSPDELFHFALCECILNDITPSNLPIALNELTPKLQVHRPSATSAIDLKLTKYKKILNALKTLQEEDGCVTVEEVSNGNTKKGGKGSSSGTGVFNLVKVWKSSPMMKAHKELRDSCEVETTIQSQPTDEAHKVAGGPAPTAGGDNNASLSTKVVSVEVLVKPKKGSNDQLVALMFPPTQDGKDSYDASSSAPLKTVVKRVLDHVRGVKGLVFLPDPEPSAAPAQGEAPVSKKKGQSKAGGQPAPRVLLDRSLTPVVALFGSDAPADCAITDLAAKVERYVSPEHIITVADRLTGKLDHLRYNGQPQPIDVCVFKFRNHWTTTLVHLSRFGFHVEEVQTFLKNKLGCGVQYGEPIPSAKEGKTDSVPEHLIIQGEPTKYFWKVMAEELGVPRDLLNECKRKVW